MPLHAVETELKFALAARSAPGILHHPIVERAAIGPARAERLSNIYYDTPQRDLSRAGVALRLRRTDGGWVQTVKWAGSALGGLHQRAELETPVPAEQLDLATLDRSEVAALFAPARVRDRLKPRFVIDFERINRTLTVGASRIVLSLDRGAIVAGKAREPISELELELADGDVAALFDLAQQLLDQWPLRPLSRSKAERGFTLCGEAAPPRKAQPIALALQMSIGQSLAVIVGEGLAQLQANEPGTLAAEDHEYLHQMRVSVRRLRSALSAYEEVASGDTLEMLGKELKWLSARLGVARDWDVFITALLPPLIEERAGDADLDLLAKSAAAAREQANRSACAAVRSRRYARLLVALGRLAAAVDAALDSAAAERPVSAFARRLLERRHQKVLERGGNLGRRSIPELHRLRIAIKKLRYASEFFGSLYAQPRAKLFRARVADLQESLGVISDQSNMPRLVQGAVRRRLPRLESLVAGWNACVVHAERKRLREAWRRFRRTRKLW